MARLSPTVHNRVFNPPTVLSLLRISCFWVCAATIATVFKHHLKNARNLFRIMEHPRVESLRVAHIEKAKKKQMKSALTDAKSQGMTQSLVEKHVVKEGSACDRWDFFKVVYYGGSDAEGAIRGSGSLFGLYLGGFFGEQRLGRLGFLV
ncbi:hypothetical protein Ahy_A07g036014 [Arachis hypogaea]|uniref:Uncharacterized protein n=1 Tax=Arachis hypogaea TaxID=3818 RepID=A0A445CF10_ARAHY|nr:hypothetical protein Ahy_A07g036014 [Arachis hypogaea]